LRRLPKVVALKVAEEAAPELSKTAAQTFDAGADPYGFTWRPGVDGQKITLHKSGDLRRFVKYVAIGTRLRIALGVRYAKYQIGKRLVFPRHVGGLPDPYVQTLQRVAARVVRREMGL
jgi:hypothetical protein